MIPTALHEGKVPSNAPNEQLIHNAPDLHPETQSEVQNQGEREDHGTVAERPSETPSEHVPGDNCAGQDAHDTVKSGRSRGECPCRGTALPCIDLLGGGKDWKDRAIGGAAIVFDVAKAAAEAFGPLKAALEAASTVYNQYKVRSWPFVTEFPLTN